ncbi:hypothetical protein [Frigidibacter sp.]|uniref:hypothetical protein n=1 Tax=Frigidibacter sp. TaxID=2586418 RepID=UPI002736B4A7|nr:hypothetical protein [Frigidibacter sp.]MDP3341899.1 hypothetical protein [Frigidibacter sp.]
MRLLTLLVLLLAGVGIAAFATRPGPAEFDATLEAAIRDRVANTDVGEGSDPFAQIALVGCKLRPSDCIRLVRDSLDVTFEDRPFTTRVTVEGLNRSATCTGAFGRFFCKDLLAN